MKLTETQCKYLTEQILGECWHNLISYSFTENTSCSKCGKVFHVSHVALGGANRAFTTWEDFGALWESATKADWWHKFCKFLWECNEESIQWELLNHYAIPEEYINPLQFALIICEWKGVE